jgi:hypothetical protein
MNRREALAKLFTLGSVAATCTGCLGYQIGTRHLYRNNIRTVHVPIIRSDSYRPELGALLTEAVQKEIEHRTSFKLTDQATADSILECRLTSDAKRVVSETNTDEPRVVQTVMTVEINWYDRRRMSLVETRFTPQGETSFYFAENTSFIPEAGQSVATANQRAIERLANHIVDQMEVRW